MIAERQLVHNSFVLVLALIDPCWLRTVEYVDVPLQGDAVASLRPDADLVALANAVARDVDALAVDLDVSVVHELTSLWASCCPTGAVHDVVEAKLEVAKHVLTGNAGAALRLIVDVAELTLTEAVRETSLLLLLKLEQVFADVAAATSLAVITWWVWTLVESDGLALGAPNVGSKAT